MIRAEGLVKVYDPSHPEVQALAGVSFVLPPRGMVFVVGKSGSGKSTLMNILGGLDRPTSGEVFIDGRPFSKMSAEEADAFRGEKIGFVFQDFLLFCLLPLLALQLLFFLPLLLHTGLGDISFLVPALAGRGLPA